MAEKKLKRILIVSHSMELGGAESSLLGLLENIDTNKFQVDLFLLRREGDLIESVPEYIRILPEHAAYTVLARPMLQTLKEGHVLLTAARLFGKIKANLFRRKLNKTGDDGVALEYSHKYTWRLMPDISPDIEYDVVISFLTPHYIAAHKVKAKKKIAWIHTDYSQLVLDTKSELRMWGHFDHIAAVSTISAYSFIQVFPELKEKVTVIENILPTKHIKKLAAESSQLTDLPKSGNYKFLSIGRFCYAKNFERIPEICSRLNKKGLDVTWFLIGFGPNEKLIKEKIKEFQVEDRVKILGKKVNPYPYILNCDYYIQPSRFEGKSVAVREAQLLEKPVVITGYPSAASQLENEVDGFIVSQQTDELVGQLEKIVNDEKKTSFIIENCRKRDFSNSESILSLYRLIED